MPRAGILKTITATNSASTSPPIDFRPYASGVFKAPTSITQVDFYVVETATGGTPGALHNSSNAAITLTVTAGKWYKLPDDCFGAGFLVVVLTGAASGALSLWLKP